MMREKLVTDIEYAQLKLLKELDLLLEENQILYFLVDSAAYYAFSKRTLPPKAQSINIAINSADADRLIEIFQRSLPENRSIETLYDEPNLSSNYIRYIDESSLMLDLVYFDEIGKPGIAINICIMIPLPNSKFKATIIRNIEYAWRLSRLKPNGIPVKDKALRSVMICIATLFGRKNVARIVYRILMRPRKKTNTYTLSNPVSLKKSIRYSKKIFEESIRVSIAEVDLPIPKKISAYLEKRYGKWQKPNAEDYRKNTWKCVTSTDIPYRKYLNRAKTDGIISESILRKIRKSELYNLNKFMPFEKERERLWAILERSEMRFYLNLVYSDKKEELIALRNQGDYETMHFVLDEYLDALRYFRKLGLGLCFDPDIFALAEELLRYEGEGSYSKVLRKLIPPEHMKSISINMQ
jgi:phosphorylcholine metabolism protein LicD